MPAKSTIAPAALLHAIKAEASRSVSPWVPARAVQYRIGGSPWALSKAADALYAQGKINRRWIGAGWWYREAA